MQYYRLLNLFSDHLFTVPRLVLYLTDGCNSKCESCNIWRFARRDMSDTILDKVIVALSKLKVGFVMFSGGEPMQHPRWYELATELSHLGIKTQLVTNGVYLKKHASQARDVMDYIFISLDAADAETYKKIRGIDALSIVLEGIEAVSRSTAIVETRTTIQRENFRQIPAIIKAAKATGAQQISFLPIDVQNDVAFGNRYSNNIGKQRLDSERQSLSLQEVAELEVIFRDIQKEFADDFTNRRIVTSPAQLQWIVDYFYAVHGERAYPRLKCNTPHFTVVIDVDGNLQPCYFLPTWGNIRDMDIVDAINTGLAKQIRKEYRSGKRPECATCVCPVYRGAKQIVNY